MEQTVMIIGASGLVGQELINQLLENSAFGKVVIFVRRKTNQSHPKLHEIIIDFNQPASWKHLVQGDILVSTLGTTLKTAKTKENQYRVDFTYQHEFAKAAAENGIKTYVLISSMGSNSKSSVFYSRMKGELEEAILKLSFPKVIIIRPSILDGDRKEIRTGEKIGLSISRFVTRFILKKYQPTPVDVLAAKIIQSIIYQTNGFSMIEGTEILN